MLLVLVLVVAGVILGMSYLSTASLRVRVSHNYQSSARARYLAESGLEHGLYLLRHFLEQFEGATGPLGPFYVEGASDGYFITAQVDAEVREKYTLTSTAYVGDATRTSSVTVYRVPAATIDMKHGLLVGAGGVWTPSSLSMEGDIHVNGDLYNSASVLGRATATGEAIDLTGGVTEGIEGNQEQVSVPLIRIADYANYNLFGRDYTAVEFTGKSLEADSPLANGGAVTADNPGGVVYLKPTGGKIWLEDGLNFTGTLIIEGDVWLTGPNVILTAVEGFPAIVTTGSVEVRKAAVNVVINGLVAADQGIIPSGSSTGTSTTINGALISKMTGYGSVLFGNHQLRYEEPRAAVYDFTLPPEERVPSVEILTWND